VFLPMTEIFIVAMLFFLALLSSFATFRGTATMGQLFQDLFFALLIGDSDGFNHLRKLDNFGYRSTLLLQFGIIGFTICVLNLIIAVYGASYQQQQAKATLLFLQE